MTTPAEAASMNKLFLANVTRAVEKMRGNVDYTLRKVLYDMSRQIIMRTPVDTGRLRGNWQFGTAEIPSGQVDDKDPASGFGGPTEKKIWNSIADAKAGTIHYIVNNLPYAQVIEYGMYPNPPKGALVSYGLKKTTTHVDKVSGGYSTQAPQGMVRITVMEYKQFLEGAVAELAGR